ncbi:cobyric acid synthase [Natronosporangium hydrolyticum]|uniref:Cobyric acid synthase n=1 Tax=Natronosporangium hydrolyticum TaxID=2811111 RepID=A0A895YBS1_9ACTN|nr:cobyric acid synthase [Natronosporangium hydrolyticum]QSB12769.1 cobyric acid synthase [Natronosporangium hydrolyticum]
MSGAILFAGTGSDVGKSVLVAGVCRYLARRGHAVAPFKAQNMALNAAVTVGGEIGRAQAAQAAAAGVTPEVAMNPILIKPTGERHSQVVVMGRPAFDADARDYHARRQALLPTVTGALADLRSRFDVVVCEGAGSAAEINLRPYDLTNLGLARAANLPVLLVTDIDRGGAFGALYGTLALLEPADQALVAGFVINRFRGDPAVLAPGLEQLRQLTGRPCLGVLPHVDGVSLDAEDSLALERPLPSTPPRGPDGLEVVVLRLPRISNFTDVDALAAEPGVSVRFTTSVSDVRRADLVVVPGSKHTVADLAWLRSTGLAAAIAERVTAGAPVLGVCGGYQLLGDEIIDEVESGAGTVAGLGVLPVRTDFHPEKTVGQVTGVAPEFGGAAAGGYEIRHGRVSRQGGRAWLRRADGADEGCAVAETYGTSWHGVLEYDSLRRALLARVADRRGLRWQPGDESFAAVRQRRYDQLGDLVESHLDTDALWSLIADGPPPDLPVAAPGGAPPPPELPR